MPSLSIEKILVRNKEFLRDKGLNIREINNKNEIRLGNERVVGMVIKRNIFTMHVDKKK